MSCRNVCTVGALAVLLVSPSSAFAHRLDQYLQATRLALDMDRVTVEIDLTAGAAVASQVYASIDADRDGSISRDEGDTYARRVISSIAVEADHRPVALALRGSQFPAFREMSLGTGLIRLRAVGRIPASIGDRHQLFYFNGHRPEMSVYLVNALVPEDSHIRITDQRRDTGQREITLDYATSAHAAIPWAPSWLLIAALAAAICCEGFHLRRRSARIIAPAIPK